MIMTRAARSPGEWTTWRFGVLLFLLQLAVWPSVIAGAKSLSFRDYGLFGYPLAEFHRSTFWEGRLPFWNPYNDCGVPFLAQWNTLTLYPGSLIYLLPPLPWSLDWFCLAHQWIAGVGMFLLCRRWSNHVVGSVVAGVGYAFGGITMSCIFWPNNIAALAWMPWVVGGLRDVAAGGAFRFHPGSILAPVESSATSTRDANATAEPVFFPIRPGWDLLNFLLAASFQMLCGAPEITLMTWLIGGVLALAAIEKRRWIRGGAGMAVAAAGVFLLSAVQLLPFLHFLGLSQRDAQYSAGEWPIPALGAANLILPWFQSYQTIHGLPLQYGQYWVPTYYAGTLIVGAAVLAFCSRVESGLVPRIVLGSLVVASVALAMGEEGGLYRAARWLFPQLGFMRFPVKWIVVASFVLPLLAATGLSALFGLAPSSAHRRIALILVIGAGLLALLAWIDVRFPLGLSSPEHPGIIMRSAVVHGIALVAGGLIVAWLVRRGSARLGEPAGLGGVVLLSFVVATDLVHAFPQAGTLVQGDVFQRGIGEASKPPRLGDGRILLGRQSILSYMRVHLDDPSANFLLKRMGAFANANLLDRVPKVDGFFSLGTRGSAAVVQKLFTQLDPSKLPIVRFLAVTKWSRDALKWEELERPRPGGWLSSAASVRILSSIEDVMGSDWNPEREAWIEPAWDGGTNDLGGSIEWGETRFDPERIEAEGTVSGGRGALATLAVSWHPGWRAWVDGREARIWRINHAFMGIVMPSGSHRVELRYREPWFATGAWMSLLGWCGWMAAAGWIWWRSRLLRSGLAGEREGCL